MKKLSKKSSEKTSKEKVVRSRDIRPLVVLFVGVILGLAAIVFGVYRNFNSEYDKFEVRTEEEQQKIVDEQYEKVKNLRNERNDEYETSALSDKYIELSRDLSAAEGTLADEEAELYNIQSGFYNNLKNEKIWGSVPLIVIGAAVIVFAVGLYMKLDTSKKKNVILTVSEEK